MLTLYIVCAVIGGGLMALAAFGGIFHGDVGMDHDVSLDTDHQIDFAHDLASTDVDHGAIEIASSLDTGFDAGDFWLAFVSLRFLTYFTGIFGMFGLVLTWFTGIGPLGVAVWSAVVAFLLGYGGSLLNRYLKVEGETSGVTSNDYIGALGRTLVPVRASQPGKVRVSIKGDTLDLIALPEGERDIEIGEEIVVVGLEGDRVRVAPKGDYLD
jgi:membrane protein implicated in regulation of membrane protease activity